MENLAKFSAAVANTSADASACKREPMSALSCLGGGAAAASTTTGATTTLAGGSFGLVVGNNAVAAGGSGGGGCIGAVGGIGATPAVSTHTSAWLAALHVSNNNNNTTDKSYNLKDGGGTQHTCRCKHLTSAKDAASNITASAGWQCDSCVMYQRNGAATLPRVALIEEDEGGGNRGRGGSGGAGDASPGGRRNGSQAAAIECSGVSNKFSPSLNGSTIGQHGNIDESPLADEAAVFFLNPETAGYQPYDLCGAVSLSPPLLEDPFDEDSEAAAAAAGGGCHSNRTSLNNSTEILSYTSDNFYGDDLILLGEDGDLEPEEVSLNSDDCVYAYRGAGAEFDLPLPAMAGMAGNFGLNQGNMAQEEETDFLEMDFDPDPPSEVEYNHPVDLVESKEQYLLQRDACHLATPTQRHQLFSSPIDDLPPAPKALQAQSLLSKNFARITLHLDQIQKDFGEDHDQQVGPDEADEEEQARERLNSALDSRPLEEEFSKDDRTSDTSHSLPNTLHEHFTNRCNSESAVISNSKDGGLAAPLQTLGLHIKSPSKITGAKPKRLSTFSSTSSTSSKNSSKSRNSLRSAFQTANLGASSSFDERSVSCSEFTTSRDLAMHRMAGKQSASLLAAPHTAPVTAGSNSAAEYNTFGDETCLDCLEKEFLANTIGKALDPLGCTKCRRRLGYRSMYNRSLPATEHQMHTSKYRRSASPTTTFFYSDQTSPTSRLFSCEFLNSQARKRQEWDAFMQEQKESTIATSSCTSAISMSACQAKAAVGEAAKAGKGVAAAVSAISGSPQSLKSADTKLLKPLKPPDLCTAIISSMQVNESSLVQALDKLQVTYDHELLKKLLRKYIALHHVHFTSSSSASAPKTFRREFNNLKEFLLFVSKRQGNYHKLQRLIGKLTQQQVTVQFKKDLSVTDLEMVPVRVADILHYWQQCNDLECLKDMDQRYQEANILGKIANIIRQTHLRASSSLRRPLPEFITIPQYYPSGYLTLSRKC